MNAVRPIHESEIARALADADKAKAEAAFFTAQARKWAADAEAAEISLTAKKRSEASVLARDEYHHVYRFEDAVRASSVALCLEQLAEWDRLEPDCDITVIFNSPGGSVIDGMALFDTLTAYSLRKGGSHFITTVVRGYAASMGGILLQAGDKRVCGPESYVMIHEISAGAGGKIGELSDQVEFFKKICARVVDIFVERAEGKISKVAFRKRWERQDWWLDSLESLRLGIVDEIG